MDNDDRSSQTDADSPEPPPKPGPTVVGVGASAGGLAALKTLFDHVPEDSGLAFVVVVHLSPEHESHLADLLQPHVKIPVQQVTETMALEPNRVYVIPPGCNLSAIDTHLRLSDLEERRRERAPIDHFFRTLAGTHDGHAVGVILSGTGSDGTLGIKEIKAKGGLTIVQDPNEAQFDGMPQSSIATGLVDLILPVAAIPAAAIRFARTEPKLLALADATEIDGEDRNLIQKIFAQLRARTGRDFSRYKRSTLLRRIGRRMQLNYIEELNLYLNRLREQPEEVRLLADDLLITVTNFFRDAEVFEYMEKHVIPELFAGRGADADMRIWSVGCATGEEAYSLAILLLEEASRRGDLRPHIQIFASDLHERSLAKAREGFYPGDIDADVSSERLKRFFIKETGGYRIRKEVRELVVFTPHNLLGDPPFSRLDLVCCRNLLIYLQRETQRDIVELFHYALRAEGYLVLGTSESIEASDLFRTQEKGHRVFRKRNVPAVEPRLPVFPLTRGRNLVELTRVEASGEPVSHGTLHQRMVELFAPPSVLVGADDKLLHYSERAGRYILHPGGQPTANLYQLVRPELRIELRAAAHAARDSRKPIRTKPIPVQFNGEAVPVIVHVQPATGADADSLLLVVFDEKPGQDDPRGENPAMAAREGKMNELEEELHLSRQRLQAIIEEYETSREEMRAANEELQSTNEELRSTMEELETSKEELQSMNEELQTVNQENRHKVEELAQLSDDLQNLLSATDIATLFLDRDLRILRFTPAVGNLFSIRMTDRGRPISDLTHRLGSGSLKEDFERVLERLIPLEREVTDDAGNTYLARVTPYRSAEQRIDGVVVMFVDISARKRAEDALRESENRYRLLVESAKEYAMLMLDEEGSIKFWSAGAQRTFGYTEAEAIGQSGELLFTPEDREAGVPQSEMATARREGKAGDDRWQMRKDGTRFWASGVTESAPSPEGRRHGFVKVLRDNTERKQLQDQQRRLTEHLEELVAERTSQVRAQEERVRDLASRLTVAEHEERHRVAQILHDDLQQLLYSIRMKLMVLQGNLESGEHGPAMKTAGEAEEWVSEALRIVHRLSVDLSPHVLAKDGLAEGLRWLAAQMAELHELEVSVKADESITLPTPMRVLLFQAVRELLFNVVKHAGVKKAHVELHSDGDVELKVSDQGKGFDVKLLGRQEGLGMVTVRHRLSLLGGTMSVDSKPDRGTTVTVRAPLES